MNKIADVFMFLKESILAPFTTTQTVKLLHIRESGSNIERFTRPPRADSFGEWDLDSDDDSMADDDLGANPDPDVMAACDRASEDRPHNENTSNGEKPPSIKDSTDSSESFEIAEILSLSSGLLQFANWAFGPDGLLGLQVLAFGDFSYDGRFHNHNHFFCRHTWSIRNPEDDSLQQSNDELILKFRPIRENDRELWELIDQNTEFLEACPTDPIIHD